MKLALEGGTPAVTPDLLTHDWERYRKANDEEVEAVSGVLRSGHLSIAMPVGMPQADALEQEFARWLGANHCLVVNSGTAALHCAVAGAGVEAGDQVIVPAITFVASAMAVLHHNAIPVFADVDPLTHLIDPVAVEAQITDKTKAIMVVHLYGLAADMDEILQLAKRHNLRVIEDCAQAYGTEYRGRKVGTLGDAAGFAMTTTKQLMVGEGGLFTTNDPEIYERAAMIRLFGERGTDMKSPDREYMSRIVGWNYKLPEVNSALARIRLRRLGESLVGYRRNARYLTGKLKELKGLILPSEPDDGTHTYYHYMVHVDPIPLGLKVEPGQLRNGVLRALKAENVDAMLWQKVPVPAQPLFQQKTGYGKGSPWNGPGGEVSYHLDQYPQSFRCLEKAFALRRLIPPNDTPLLDAYAHAFEKVFSQIDRVLASYQEAEQYQPLAARLEALAGSS